MKKITIEIPEGKGLYLIAINEKDKEITQISFYEKINLNKSNVNKKILEIGLSHFKKNLYDYYEIRGESNDPYDSKGYKIL